MDYLPLFVSLQEVPVLVVGGGEVAARKITLLRAAGASITLVAPEVCAELTSAVHAGDVMWKAARFTPDDVHGQRLVIAATNDSTTNAAVAAAAQAAQIFVNVVDDAVRSNCVMPAIVDRSPVIVAISTGGASPVLATELRAQLETFLAPRLGALARFALNHRHAVKARHPDLATRRKFWLNVLRGEIADCVLGGDDSGAEKLFANALAEAPRLIPQARVILIALAKSDPDLLTLGALRALYTADAVYYDTGLEQVAAVARRDAPRHPLTEATTAFDFLHSRLSVLATRERHGQVVAYLCHHHGAWVDLLGGELRARGVLT
ncbi:MAG: hypothetical protein HYX63_18830 [Gammaproteobacteria bacterium]|nr:hypothetical protein [Gammaproteobacteria bacterium]